MEEDKQNGDAAANLMKQFMDNGILTQDEDGFVVNTGATPGKKFKPFDDE